MTDDLDRVTRRLDRDFYSAPRFDGLLEYLVSIARAGYSVPIGLVANGVVFRGALTKIDQFVSELDSALEILAEAMPEASKTTNIVREGIQNMAQTMEKNRATADETLEKYPPDATIDEIEEEDVGDVMRSLGPPFALHIRDAQCFLGSEWRNVGSVRVRLAHVTAWWPLESEAGVSVNYVGNP